MHTLIRDFDEYHCPKCRKRWGIDEEEPLCVTLTVPNTLKPDQLIGFLSIKLAEYEPESILIQQAKDYLKCRI